ncbi:MAG TPA: glycosyltransferase [Actinobacteria bacterium]|nr:glycosyltransferase [Actinomycetota bacterium]
MRISVVVPFHNVERYIENCIRALLSQHYPQDCYEIILVDNDSTDGTAAIVRRYPRVRLLSEPKAGAYAARNRGVAESGGEIIAFTDSDCSPQEDWLQKIDEAMVDPVVAIVQGRRRFACESLGLSILSDYEAEKAAYAFSARTEEIYYGYTNNMAVRRGVFDRTGPFLELDRGADVILVHRVIAEYSCNAVRYSPDLCVRHLEVTSIWQWFRKMRIYGQSFRGYSKLVPSRPLGSRERLQVLRATIRRGGYSAAKSLLSIVLLSAGALYYELGRRWPTRNVVRSPRRR